MLGLLNVHKPTGITSRDAVNHVQKLVRPEKVGHAGTLDPLASGVLVISVGAATRLTEYVQLMPKTYRAAFRLGCRSDTDDSEGCVIAVACPSPPDVATIENALASFVGDIRQTPPAYSAIKVGGQRAYALARRGQAVTLQPRTVSIYRIVLEKYEFPTLQVEIACGSGTYVRSIGRDLGELLGTGAVMTDLSRTAVGDFLIQDSVPLTALTRETVLQHLLPPLRALDGCPRLVLSPDETVRVTQGQFLQRAEHDLQGPVAAVDAAHQLVAVLRPVDANQLRPAVVLRDASRRVGSPAPE